MGLLKEIVVGGIITLAAAEAAAAAPEISQWIIRRAVRRVDPQRRDRYAEEWIAHAAEHPGPISQIAHACGCWLASFRMMGVERYLAMTYSVVVVLCELVGHLSLFRAKVCFVRARNFRIRGQLDATARFHSAARRFARTGFYTLDMAQASRIFARAETFSYSSDLPNPSCTTLVRITAVISLLSKLDRRFRRILRETYPLALGPDLTQAMRAAARLQRVSKAKLLLRKSHSTSRKDDARLANALVSDITESASLLTYLERELESARERMIKSK
jgi:hypothetical protein